MLPHYLASIAYRLQKALRDAPDGFPDFSAGPQVRTPHELIRHMTDVLAYALWVLAESSTAPSVGQTFREDVARFHAVLEALRRQLETPNNAGMETVEDLLQGPFSDVMTHVGQIALLRRLAGSPVLPEDFMAATIDRRNVGPDQPKPVRSLEADPGV